MAEAEQEGLLGWLDGPRIVFAGVIIYAIALGFLGILLWDDQREQIDRVDALIMARLEEARASDRRQVESCFATAAQGPALRRVLRAIERETMDPQARQDLRDFRQLNALNTPTVRECRQLAERLNVKPPGGTGG